MSFICCTLYNSLYLDKGLVLYDSLRECAKDFELYVLCMDDKCYDVLTDLHLEHHVPIKLSDFEEGDKELLTAKLNRSFGEYCWTCTPSIILYIFNRFNEKCCTYIDADMYFYHDPQFLVKEMLEARKSVMITPHRFSYRNMHFLKNGIYCVEFNTFINDEGGMQVLNKWRKDCLECCTSVNDGIHFGDQKYLDSWPEDFPAIVHVCQNQGAGIAPWNIDFYRYGSPIESTVIYEEDGKELPLFFYHFQEIRYLSESQVLTGIPDKLNTVDYKLIRSLYVNYLMKIKEKKLWLKKIYDVDILIRNHPGKRETKSWRDYIKSTPVVNWILICVNPRKYKYYNQFVVNIE